MLMFLKAETKASVHTIPRFEVMRNDRYNQKSSLPESSFLEEVSMSRIRGIHPRKICYNIETMDSMVNTGFAGEVLPFCFAKVSEVRRYSKPGGT